MGLHRGVAPRIPRAASPTEIVTTLLSVIGAAPQPIGARAALTGLRQQGVTESESTINRRMRQLDAEGMTESVSGKGRVLTEKGKGFLALAAANRRLGSVLAHALDVRNLFDLLDWLVARRAIEREAARAAARHGNSEDIERLEREHHGGDPGHRRQAAGERLPGAEGLGFHRLLGRASRNRVLIALSDAVFDPQLNWLDELLDVIISAGGARERSAHEHEEMTAAIRAGDIDRAGDLAAAHIDRLIQAVEDFAASNRPAVVERLLALVKPSPDLPSA
jgi:DNA-binding FadR family transcriptional regulator